MRKMRKKIYKWIRKTTKSNHNIWSNIKGLHKEEPKQTPCCVSRQPNTLMASSTGRTDGFISANLPKISRRKIIMSSVSSTSSVSPFG